MSDLRVTEHDVELPDGRTLRVFDTGSTGSAEELPVWWHHGSPGLGTPPAPLFELAHELGVRWLGHTRPGYPGSSALPDRSVASVAADVAAAADALGLGRFAVLGHSGGGPHALATAALLGARVPAVVAMSSLAPVDAVGLDWFAGLGPGGAAELRAAAHGRAELEAHLAGSEDEPDFTAADVAALQGDWHWFIDVVGPAMAEGLGGFVDDDLANTRPWGVGPASVRVPTLLVHGDDDAVVPPGHSDWLAAEIPDAELWRRPGEGHVSIMGSSADALRWLVDAARAALRPT